MVRDFDWSCIPDLLRRSKILRWKQKRERIFRGECKRHVYDVRVKYAARRPRVGGRFAYGSESKVANKQTEINPFINPVLTEET